MQPESRPPFPPFDESMARQKVRMAEDSWNTRDPERVALAYSLDSQWRNRSEFIGFLKRKWHRELDYRLIKGLWAFHNNRIAVRFAPFWSALAVLSIFHRTDRAWLKAFLINTVALFKEGTGGTMHKNSFPPNGGNPLPSPRLKVGASRGLLVTVIAAERWDRSWLVFAWVYYWLNIAGWSVEVRGEAHHWRANTEKTRAHALWR